MAADLTADLLSDLDVALNESRWLDAAVRGNLGEAIVLLEVLSLPESGPEPDDRRLMLRLVRVGRVAASLRKGRWDDDDAELEMFELDGLSDVVHSFGGQPIYGWEFFDPPEAAWDRWRNRLSLDETFSGGSTDHVLQLFQESLAGSARHLDLRIWFGELSACDYDWRPRELPDVAVAGKRWWAGLYASDPRTNGHGIVPAGPWREGIDSPHLLPGHSASDEDDTDRR